MRSVVLGGDRRSAYLALRMLKAGEETCAVGFEQLKTDGLPRAGVTSLTTAERVVLPIPITADRYSVSAPFADMTYPIETVFRAIPKNASVYGGKVEPCVLSAAARCGLTVIDYAEREDFRIANADLTAEGALELAIRETDGSLRGARVLVLGFGRVARAVSKLFDSVDANVRTAARRTSDLADIRSLGYEPLDIRALQGRLSDCDLIVNTAPAPILTEPLLRELPKTCPVIDLASDPGGVDTEATKQLGVRVVSALGLPGRTAPKAAGEAIWDTITAYERGGGMG